MKKRAFLSEIQLNYVEDIIFKRDTENIGMSRKKVIQVISDIGQTNFFDQADNQLDYLIWEKRLVNLKRLRQNSYRFVCRKSIFGT